MKNLISPPHIVEVEKPLIFLAGPMQGTYDWQELAINLIHSKNPEIMIASPRADYSSKDFVYEKQVDWETYYLNKASKDGLILFWLAKETNHDCREPYGQTTRFELAEWKIKHENSGARLVLGIEEGFSNARYIRRRFSQDCPNVPILDSLESTCFRALEIIST